MDVIIREATLLDARVLGDIFSLHLDEQCSMDPLTMRNPAFFPRDFIETMLSPRLNQIFIAFAGDRPVGFVRICIMYGEQILPLERGVKRLRESYLRRLPVIFIGRIQNILDRVAEKIEKRRSALRIVLPMRRGYIADIYVQPDQRRKKIGQLLMDEAMRWFKQMGIGFVDLYVLGANEVGRAFWRSLGFQDQRISMRKIIGD